MGNDSLGQTLGSHWWTQTRKEALTTTFLNRGPSEKSQRALGIGFQKSGSELAGGEPVFQGDLRLDFLSASGKSLNKQHLSLQ